MRKILLMSSALVASGLLSGGVEAACIQTPNCTTLGYTSTTACEGGLKCPWGNAWFCNVGGGGSSTPDYSNCKIGDILYSDMSCNANMVASKTPIGVVFDTTNGLAIAKDEFTGYAQVGEDISGIKNYSSNADASSDWEGFNNTKAMYNADKSGNNYTAIKSILTYTTTGTEQGQWYLPAGGELNTIGKNKDILNTTLSKIGGTQLSGNYWSSSERNYKYGYYITIGNSDLKNQEKTKDAKARPVINYLKKSKIDFAFSDYSETACSIGSLLYSDKKCYAGGASGSGKTAIGVVFDAEKRKAAAIGSGARYTCLWSTETVVVPGVTTCSTEYCAYNDDNGKANTAAIKSYNSDLSKYPAAKYVYNYTTTGTKAGDWYLPTLGELVEMRDNKVFLAGTLIFSHGYWSSTQRDNEKAWIKGQLESGYNNTTDKNIERDIWGELYALPVLAF